MKPRNLRELNAMSADDLRALVADFMGIHAEPQEGCRLDWLPLGDESVCVESELSEDWDGSGVYVATNVLVNGEWVDADAFGATTQENWRDELERIVKREREDAREQEAA